jgi:uncharacterized membrane protein
MLTIILSVFFSALTIALVIFTFVIGVAVGERNRENQFKELEKIRNDLMNRYPM